MASIKNNKIFLYSSQLAAFIGRNIHTSPNKIFNKLYETYFGGEMVAMKLDMDLKGINVSDRNAIEKMATKMDGNKDLKERLDKICQKNDSSIGMKRDVAELEKKVMEDKKLDATDKLILKKAIEGYSNKKYGTIKENNALDVYKSITGNDVVTKIQSRSKKICEYEGKELWLISKMDAMTTDGIIVEIKNRMYKLFDEMREYEWLQVQAYLEVYNLEKGELVEYLKDNNGEMRIKPIDRDRTFWNEIVLKEVGFFFRTMINLVHNDKKITKYMKLSDTEQNEFIKKMVRKEAKEN